MEDDVTLLRSGTALAAVPAALLLALAGCSSDDDASGTAAGSSAPSSSAAAESTAAEAAGEPFGPACADVPTSGDGSFESMAETPVATAASGNPLLSALAEAVDAANLVDSLNSQDDVTVLAPANQAFEAVPADALEALLADNARLTAVLTHHVLEGRIPPDQLAGEHTTLNGDTVTVEGSGEDFTVPADQTVTGKTDAAVVCGNVQTANATVYVIDQVLTPPAG
jgi:uncharacterized surface protein with fasciclin (FAS1) repeats